jgi:bifunctional DNA-binding transcriptional regulator/antitoxin component of YhaV-PrlF toxin-antitoxin module
MKSGFTMAGNAPITVTMDSKGRLLIPEATRKEMHFEPGDVFFIENESEYGTVRIAKAINPFDGLALAAIAEDDAGETVSLADALQMIEKGLV